MFGPSPPQAVTVPRLGQLRWAELQVFAVAGRWSGDDPDPAAAVAFGAVSMHAAWRARTIGDRLPPAGHLNVAVVTVAASPGLGSVVADLAALTATADRVAVLAEVVLPALASAVGDLLATLSPVADAPSLRALPLVVDDVNRDVALLAGLAVPTGPAAGVVDRFSASLVAAGGW